MGSKTTMQQQLFIQFLNIIWKSSTIHFQMFQFCVGALCNKTISSSHPHTEPFASLLQDGELLQLKEGLNHPHGKDVHFRVHHDFLFLQQICGMKQAKCYC